MVVEFNHVGDHGVEREGVYPWDRWMNGNTWGFDIDYYGTTEKNFRKRLHEKARYGNMKVEIERLRLDNSNWIIFTFDSL